MPEAAHIFVIMTIIGAGLLIGTLLKWKPITRPNEDYWFGDSFAFISKFFGRRALVLTNILFGLFFLFVGVAGILAAYHVL